MLSLRQEILPPDGVEFFASLNLTPSTVPRSAPLGHSVGTTNDVRVLCNVVVARSSTIRIFEVREEPAPIASQTDFEREKRGKVRRGTEAVEGEVEMDTQGEGFVNMGSVKSLGQNQTALPPTVNRLYFIRSHRLHGIVTGIDGVKIRASTDDKLDRLLISFKDAKIALLEWSEAVHNLITVSIHTYERAPQLMSLDPSLFRAKLRVDPVSRCAALLLPKDSLAILPFYQTQAELDNMDQDHTLARDVPYSPSFILDLAQDVDERIRHIIDFAFLPGFNNPTIAVLFETQQTWTGRLKEFKDTVRLFIFTLDLVTRNCPLITIVEGLPHDSLSLTPCGTSLGGVVVLASNSIIYVDQASRRIALPMNGWASRSSDLQMQALRPDDLSRCLSLEGSHLAFVDERTLFVILKDGSVYPLELIVDGKLVSRLSLGSPVAQTTFPAVVKRITDELLFVGSTIGPSVLLKTTRVEEEIKEQEETTTPSAVVDVSHDMEIDDDDDIYGGSKVVDKPSVNGHAANGSLAPNRRSVIHLSLCDSLPAHGPIADMTFSMARNGDRPVSELVAATGSERLGGFTLFQRELPSRIKRKLHAIGGGRGMWSLPIRQSMKLNGSSVGSIQSDHDTLILSTDANPTPGLSRIATRNARNDVSITTRMPGTTVSAGAFFQATAILHVMTVGTTNLIRVLEPDGTERQVIKDLDGNVPRARIRSCSIADPFVMIIREDDTLGLFVGDTERGRIRRKDMSPMGHKTSRYLAGCFFTDYNEAFRTQVFTDGSGAEGDNTSTLQAAINAGQRTQWLILCRPQGVMEIWTLPKLSPVFSAASISALESVITDSGDGPALSLPEDPPRKPQELDVDQISLTTLGESSPHPHLLIFLRSGHLAIYDTSPCYLPVDTTHRESALRIQFAKVASRTFEIQLSEEVEKSVLAEQRRISRLFIPFMTSPAPKTTLQGVFFTGDTPCWILATDKGGVAVYPSGHTVVHSFTACSLWDSKGDFLLYSDEGPSLVEWIPDLQLHNSLPSRFIPRSRAYSNVVFDSATSLIVAAASLQAKFASFDEEGNKIWEPDTPNVSEPSCDCSTLELISPDSWLTMDGFELPGNEFINTLECVTLETLSTETGSKDFIAIGTTVDRGEDLAVKGATYIFEIVEVVPDPALKSKRSYRLRLHCRDDAKGPVTAVCSLNGYLVSSMGQKVFVRAFDMDERLVGVAFLDAGVYVTSLRAIKNLLLIGDAVKSVWFVAFQEDPYKLVVLAKDVQRVCVTSADFLFADGRLAIVTGDEDGVVRLYEYDPADPESKGGQHLLCRTEFYGQVEYRTSVTVARRTKEEDMSAPQARLICGATDGSLSSLTPVDEATFKRLHLLQGQLTRNVQHVAGLNPKAFRIVRNDFVSKPLSKNILDGHLLAVFEELSIKRQDEMTRQIGTERATVMRDWRELSSLW